MFAASYFGKRYFDGDYYPPVGDVVAPPVTPTGGGSMHRGVIRIDRRQYEDEEMLAMIAAFLELLE